MWNRGEMRLALGALLMIGAGCVGAGSSAPADGNDELGIAEFKLEDSRNKTTIVGLDAAKHEVARVEIVHGRFTLTGMFKDDYPGQSEVDGRKLDVSIAGTSRLEWQTMGYDAVVMPPHPGKEWEVARLLDDPHVKPALQKWKIAFEAGPLKLEEEPYAGATIAGNSSNWCYYISGGTATCGTARDGLTINLCGGDGNSLSTARATRTTSGGFTYNEHVIAQCCPSSPNWFAIKSCPTDGSSGSTAATTCGTAAAGAACKACAGYPANYYSYACSTYAKNGGVDYSWATQSEASTCASTYNYQSCYPGSSYAMPTNDTCFASCPCNYVDFGFGGMYMHQCY